MNRLRWCLVIVGVMLAGCQLALPGGSPTRTRQHDEGAVYVYLQPLARDMAPLRMSLGSLAAVRPDGTELPLSVSRLEGSGAEVGRQRLVASGPVPAGEYTGFVMRITRASVRRDRAEAPLTVPDDAVRVDHRFTVRRDGAVVVGLALRHPEPLATAGRFAPVFAAYAPERPAVGLMGFVANGRSNDVTVFDKKARQVFDVIATGRAPAGMALDQRARRLYVALAGDDAVEVVDVAAGTVSTPRIRLTPGDEPVALALTRDGRTLLTANKTSNTVSVVDAESRFEVTRVRVGNGPRAIVIDRDGRLAFVFNTLSNALSVVDVASRTVVRSIPTEPGPVHGHFNRDGTRLYVVYETASYVSVVNVRTLAVTARFPLRAPMETIKVDPATDHVYLAGRRDLVVGVYEPFAFGAIDVIDTGTGIVSMAADTDENHLYLVSPGTNRVLVVERIRKRLLDAFDVGDGPAWISLMGEQ